MITKQTVTHQLQQYLDGRLSQEDLVAWAETAMMGDEPLAKTDAATLADILSKLGLSDVREFGLTWQVIRDMLDQLGFNAHVELQAV